MIDTIKAGDQVLTGSNYYGADLAGIALQGCEDLEGRLVMRCEETGERLVVRLDLAEYLIVNGIEVIV